MINFKNKKNRFLIFFFRRYFKYLLKKNFYRINLKGNELLQKMILRSKNENIPIIMILNHPNWWDAAFVIHFSYNYMKMNGYCLMEYKQMAEFKFFNKIGAVPIIRDNARYSLKSLNFIVKSVENKSNLAVVFPQAELVNNSKKPYKFYSGFNYIINKLDNVILICGYLDYRFTTEQRPELYINIFESFHFNSRKTEKSAFINYLERKYELINSDFENDFVKGNLNGFEVILQGRKSLSS